jgi:hypothetical protein
LFAALNVVEGQVIGQCMSRHRHQEFIRFLNKINRETPAERELHLILDNYATHKHPKSLMGWMAPERHLCAKLGMQLQRRGPSMTQVTTIGLDLGKRVFQVHGVDAAGRWCSAASSGAGRWCHFSPSYRAV